MRNTYYIHHKLKALMEKRENLYKRLSSLFMDEDLEFLVKVFENNPDLCFLVKIILNTRISPEDQAILKASLHDALNPKERKQELS